MGKHRFVIASDVCRVQYFVQEMVRKCIVQLLNDPCRMGNTGVSGNVGRLGPRGE